MSREPIVPWVEPKIPPQRPLQFSLRTLFLFMLTVCLVLGVGYATSASSQSAAVGVLWGSGAALLAWAVWSAFLFRSARISLTTTFLWFVLGLVVLPPITQSLSPPTRGFRSDCRANIKQITQALLLYQTQEGSFPPAYTVDDEGNRLHSWRTLILPYIEKQMVYDAIDLSQPWDAPENQQGTDVSITDYQCESHPRRFSGPFSSYVAVVGPETMWPGEEGRKRSEVTDGTANTILIVEYAGTDIAWAEPRDLTLEEVIEAFNAGDVTGIGGYHPGGAHVVAVDNHVFQLDLETLTVDELRALFTVAGGEDPEESP